MWGGDAVHVFTVGVMGEFISVLLRAWTDEMGTFGAVLRKASLPLAVEGEGDLEGKSKEASGQLEAEGEDAGDTEEPALQIGRPLGKRGGEDTGETPLSLFFMRGVLSPGSSSLSTVDWRVGMLVVDIEATKA